MASARCSLLRTLGAAFSAALLVAALTACSGGMTQTPTPFVEPTVGAHATPASDSDAESGDTPEASASDGVPISNGPQAARSPNAHASTKPQPSQTPHHALTPSPHPATHAAAQCARTAKKASPPHCTLHVAGTTRKKHATCKKSTQTGKTATCN